MSHWTLATVMTLAPLLGGCTASFEYEPCSLDEAYLPDFRLCDVDTVSPVSRAAGIREEGGMVLVVGRVTELEPGEPTVYTDYEPWLARQTRGATYRVIDSLGEEIGGDALTLWGFGSRFYFISEAGDPLCDLEPFPAVPLGAPCVSIYDLAPAREEVLVFIDADGRIEHWCDNVGASTARCTQGVEFLEVELDTLRR